MRNNQPEWVHHVQSTRERLAVIIHTGFLLKSGTGCQDGLVGNVSV